MENLPLSTSESSGAALVLNTKLYTYKEKNYEVIRIIKSKCPYYGHWFLSVEYKALYDLGVNSWAGHFSRHIDEFNTKFKPTEKTNENRKEG